MEDRQNQDNVEFSAEQRCCHPVDRRRHLRAVPSLSIRAAPWHRPRQYNVSPRQNSNAQKFS